MTPDYTPTRQDITADRALLMKRAVEEQLQYLITQAAEYRRLITEAKTDTKKKYFEKKQKKLNEEVLQLVGAMQRLQGYQPTTPTLGDNEPNNQDQNTTTPDQ